MKTNAKINRFGLLGFLGSFMIAGLILLYGCTDEFLEGPAQGVLDENTLNNQAGVEGNLIATYSVLDGYTGNFRLGTSANNFDWGGVASDNAYKGSEPGDRQPLSDIELYQWSTGGVDGFLNEKWTILYEGINRANATISLLETIEDISDNDRQSIRGEAQFLRAHYHFEAWKMWKNIPYYTEEVDDPRKPNTDADPIPLILADLNAAIDLLPETQSEVGRVTRWTAKAYKGRVQVYSGDYSGGRETLRDVVNNGPYELEENQYRMFSAFHENGPGTVLAYQASSNDGDPNGANANFPTRTNFPHGGSPFGCCGFNQPSQNLVNAFRVNDNGLPLSMTDDSWNDIDENLDSNSNVPVDPRLDWTVARDGVPVLDWGSHEPGWIRDRSFAGPYSDKKNLYEKNSDAASNVGWVPTNISSLNLHLYRYADVLLLLAEAEVETGNLEAARTIVNQIRERAGAVAQGPGTSPDNIAVPIDDPSITWANYQIGLYNQPWTDQQMAREAVRTERRLELAQEGHRLFDLRRWGMAEEVINQYIAVEQNRREYLSGAVPYTDRHQLYPIPSIQIELSEVEGENRLVQNPGW